MVKIKHLKRAVTPLMAGIMVLSPTAPALAQTQEVASGEIPDGGASREAVVTYDQESAFTVTIPKAIVLSSAKSADYSISVKGSVDKGVSVTVAPRDDVVENDGVNFWMADANGKADVTADVTQEEVAWMDAEITEAGTAKPGSVNAPGLSAGQWQGILNFDINMEGEARKAAPEGMAEMFSYSLDEEGKFIILESYAGNPETGEDEEDVSIYGSYLVNGEEYRTKINDLYSFFASHQGIRTIAFDKGIETSDLRRTGYMVSECASLENIDFSNLDLSHVTDMSHMFECEMSTSGLKTINFSGADTSSVTNMASMFAGCRNLKELDLSSFNTSNVVNMSQMFSACDSLATVDVSSFDTCLTTNMFAMFSHCGSLMELDLSSFNMSSAESLQWMFKNCTVLETIYAGTGWIEEGKNTEAMFEGCMAQSVTLK